MAKRKYPDSFHLYKVIFADGSTELLHACGSTNAVYIASQKWDKLRVADVEILDDSWKNSI